MTTDIDRWEDDELWRELSLGDKIELVRSAVSMTEIAELLGIELDPNDKFRPPWNQTERTPSCQLYDDHFYDFASGRHGDFIDLWRAYVPDSSVPKIVNNVRYKAAFAGCEPGDVEAVPPRVLSEMAHLLPPDPAEYGPGGIDVRPFGVRADGTGLWIPHAQAGKEPAVYGIKRRWFDGRKTSVPGSQFTHRLYSPTGWYGPTMNQNTVVIAEGESDAWALWHEVGHMATVLALPSGANAWKDHWLEDLEPYDRILLCFDNDKAGQAAYDKVIRKTGYGRTDRLKVPGLYGDAREAIQAGWVPAHSISM